MKNQVKVKMKKGEKPIGTFYELGGLSVVECLGAAGLDFIIIDMEHGPFDKESCMDVVRAAELSGLTPFARVAEPTHLEIQKAVDAGVCGIIVPGLKTIDEVKQAVNNSKFIPVGKRGYAPVRSDLWGAAEYAQNGIEKYMEYCNEEILVIPQCETAELLEVIDEVAKIEGVDGIFVGPFDLSISLGKPAQFEHPDVKGAIEKVVQVCKENDKFSFIFTGDAKGAKCRFEEGFDAIACSMDAIILINAFKKLVEEIKER